MTLETKQHSSLPDQEGKEIPTPVKIAVLVSNKSKGTNLQAIIDAIDRGDLKNIQIDRVLSDQPGAQGLERAKTHQIPNEVRQAPPRRELHKRVLYSQELAEYLNQNGIQIVVLAGFATILDETYFKTFNGVTINVHPGVLHDENDNPLIFPNGKEAPDNKGKLTENSVSLFLPFGYAGSTIHVATLVADSGPVIERTEFIEVLPQDLEDSGEKLYNERLKPAEHRALIRALKDPRRIFEIAGKSL